MGAEKTILEQGEPGKTPKKGDTVTVDCTGYGKNGDIKEKFWSTLDEGQTAFSFKVGLGQVIKGWDEQVLTMELGEKADIMCSPDYAYGASGFPAWGYPFQTLRISRHDGGYGVVVSLVALTSALLCSGLYDSAQLAIVVPDQAAQDRIAMRQEWRSQHWDWFDHDIPH